MHTTLNRVIVVFAMCGISYIASTSAATAQTALPVIDSALQEPQGAVVSTEAADQHVRSHSSAIRALIQRAIDRSATFRQLVATINGRDAIVYVEDGACGRGVRACVGILSAAGGHRMLWVKIDTRKEADWNLMGSIGHELRHTVEILDDPTVTNSTAMFFFYQRIGYLGTKQGARETRTAINAGDAVRSELRAFDRR